MLKKFTLGWTDGLKTGSYTMYPDVVFESYEYLGNASNNFFEGKPISIASVEDSVCSTYGVLVDNKEGVIIESTLIGLNPRMQGKQEESNYFDDLNKIIPTCQMHFHLEEVSYCLNSWDTNYQHFIVETLPKIHVSVLEKNCPVVVLDMPFIREIVMIAYPDVEFIFIKDDVGVEAKLVNIPMPVAQNFESIVNLQMLAFDNLRNKILFPVPQTSEKLYLARIHTDGLAGRFRRMTNYSEVMEFFVNDNFVVDDFVDKTLVEKMILTAKFRKHVTPIGANLINYLFAQNPIDLYVLSHPYFNSHQYFINLFEAMKLPIKYHIIPAGIEAVGEDNWIGHLNSPYRIDMNILAPHLH